MYVRYLLNTIGLIFCFVFTFLFLYIKVQDVGAEKNATTFLRAPTHYVKPNWDRLVPSIVEKYPETDSDVGVVSPVLYLLFYLQVSFFGLR